MHAGREGAGMGELMILCPRTGKYLPVGIIVDAGSFESMTFIDNLVTCPHCGETHVWGSKEARLIERHDEVEPGPR
jgi:hypothetical protein